MARVQTPEERMTALTEELFGGEAVARNSQIVAIGVICCARYNVYRSIFATSAVLLGKVKKLGSTPADLYADAAGDVMSCRDELIQRINDLINCSESQSASPSATSGSSVFTSRAMATDGGAPSEAEPEFDADQMQAIVDFAIDAFVKSPVNVAFLCPPMDARFFGDVAAEAKREYCRAGRYNRKQVRQLLDQVSGACARALAAIEVK